MRRKKILLPLILGIFVFSSVFALQAQEEEKTFTGNVLLGYRAVDTSGAFTRYKQDFNLDDGVRLFNLNMHFTPKNGLKKLFDRLDLSVYNFGGDPYETLGLSIQKYGTYKFRYDRKKSTYFYDDQHDVGGGTLYDHHTFNFERLMDTASLNVWLGKNVQLYMNYDRYTKNGESVTTFDIERIEFEFEKPIEEQYNAITLGITANYKGYSFSFEEKIMDFENTNSLFLPGFADGGSSARYPSALYYFNLDQPYDLKTNTHTFRLNAKPIKNLLISGSAALSQQDMELSYSEESAGVNYLNRFYMTDSSGEATFDRKFQLFDVDITYLLFDKLAVIGSARYHTFEQEGEMTVDSEEMPAALGYDTLGIEGGLQYQHSSKLALTVGYRYENRTLDGMETVAYEQETTRNGFFGNAKLNFSRAIMLTLDYQLGNTTDPYTLIGPTDFSRFRATAKIRKDDFSFTGSYLCKKSESEIYSDLWDSTKNELSLRFGYHGKTLMAFAGYSLIDIKHEADRDIAYPPGYSGPPGTFPWEIMYEGKSNLFDASLSLNLEESWRFGGYFNAYKNTGFWEISRTTFKAYVEYAFANGFVTQVGYRYVDFNEDSSGYNDYKANIFEISFGHRWK